MQDCRFKLMQTLPKNTNCKNAKIIFNIGFSNEQSSEEKVKFSVGRHSNSNFRLDSKDLPCFISRQHAEIVLSRNNNLTIEDLKSRNGTFVNDVLLQVNDPVELRNGDVVTFGCIAPNTTISPGTIMVQKDSQFKFLVQSVSENCANNIKKSSLPYTSLSTPDTMSSPHSFTSIHKNNETKSSLTDDSGILSSQGDDEVCKSEVSLSEFKLKNEQTPPENLALTENNLLAYHRQNVKSQEKSLNNKENEHKKKQDNVKTTNCSKLRRRKTFPLNLNTNKIKNTKSKSKSTKRKSLPCSSFECSYPEDKKSIRSVTWVQCDSCDKWFHTECVGCNYNTVKKSNQEFHCGLC